MKYSIKQRYKGTSESLSIGGDVEESFTENFLKVQCLPKQQFTEQWQNFITGSVLDKKNIKKRHVLTKETHDNIGAPHCNKSVKATNIQNDSCAESSESRL
jgi:hypothetical protein